jgi:hypothetical protein
MRFFGGGNDNPNAIVGILLLIMLAIFAGPTTLPRLLSDLVPFADEGVPCSRLRIGEDRAFQQSLIGRSVSQGEDSPFVLSVRTSAIPADPTQSFTITIVVYNRSLGTVPMFFTPNQITTTPGSTNNGFGVVVGTNPVSPVQPVDPATVGPYPEESIRLLGPRQRCVHRVEYVFSEIPSSSQFAVPGTEIRAYYRNNTAGGIVVGADEGAPIYTDQGLWVGVTLSEPSTLRAPAQQ